MSTRNSESRANPSRSPAIPARTPPTAPDPRPRRFRLARRPTRPASPTRRLNRPSRRRSVPRPRRGRGRVIGVSRLSDRRATVTHRLSYRHQTGEMRRRNGRRWSNCDGCGSSPNRPDRPNANLLRAEVRRSMSITPRTPSGHAAGARRGKHLPPDRRFSAPARGVPSRGAAVAPVWCPHTMITETMT